MKFKTLRTLLSLLFVSMTLAFVSCGDDDDKVDCNKAYDAIGNAIGDYYDAAFDGNCEDLDDLYDVAVKALKKGKNCSKVKDELKDGGYDSVNEFLDDFEDQHQDNVDECAAD